MTQKLGSLKGLAARLQEVEAYLQNVLSGRLPVNHRVIYQLQARPPRRAPAPPARARCHQDGGDAPAFAARRTSSICCPT